MSRGLKIFGVIAIAGLVLHAVLLLDTHPEQDECAFGPVSNGRYRELLAEAEKYQSHNWPFIVWSDATLQRLLTAQFAAATSEASTTYEKIATMHAILRGIGADFLYREPANDPFGQTAERGGWVSFGYQINVDRLALFYPGGRKAWLIGSLAGPKRSSSLTDFDRKHPQGDLHFVAHYPNPIDPIPDVLHRGPQSCPGVPNADHEPFFRADAK
jgi:hypothetical protein